VLIACHSGWKGTNWDCHISLYALQQSVPKVWLSVCVSVCLSVCPSIRPSVHPSVRPSVRLFNCICLVCSAEAALDQFAMKRFYDDKLGGVTQPSQRRYVHYFEDILKNKITLIDT
jgi:hypothetical protein